MKTLIRCYIVDDESLAVLRLTRLLEATGRVDIAGSETDPDAALAYLAAHSVDAIFLDIQMPGLTGFELLERLPSPPAVVFVTAYDQYALDAFEANSVDYLLKPVDAERLDRALDRLERMTGQPLKGDAGASPEVRALARALAGELRGDPPRDARGPRPAPLIRMASKVGERTTILEVSRVSHFVAKDKLAFAVTAGREHVIDYTLAQLESRLDPRRFVRIHRGALINLACVQELFPGIDGGMLVRLKDEAKTELAVARDRVRVLKDALGI